MGVHSGVIVVNLQECFSLFIRLNLKKVVVVLAVISDLFNIVVPPVLLVVRHNHVKHVFMELFQGDPKEAVVLSLVVQGTSGAVSPEIFVLVTADAAERF